MPMLMPLYRLSARLHKVGLWKAAVLVKVANFVLNGADIAPNARLGRVRIPHPSGVVIAANTVVEDGTIIMSGVVLGRKDVDKDTGAPLVGANCTIGTGSKILGNIRVGDGAVIGANSVVLADVSGKSVVAGNPAVARKYLAEQTPWQ